MTFSFLLQAGLRGISGLIVLGLEGHTRAAQPDHPGKGAVPWSLLQPVLLQQVITALSNPWLLRAHAGQEPPQCLAAVVIQGGGVDGLGVLGVDDAGAEEAAGFVAGSKRTAL